MNTDLRNMLNSVACRYHWRLEQARDIHRNDPMRMGREAAAALIRDLDEFGAKRVLTEMSTGVDGRFGGFTRYDVCFSLGGFSIYAELQASPYKSGHKAAQAMGQVLGFFAKRSGARRPDYYVKIIGEPRLINIWMSSDHSRLFKMGDYEPTWVVHY